jgi:hypothetical protein
MNFMTESVTNQNFYLDHKALQRICNSFRYSSNLWCVSLLIFAANVSPLDGKRLHVISIGQGHATFARFDQDHGVAQARWVTNVTH